MDTFADWFAQVQLWLFEAIVQPLMFGTGLGGLLSEGFSATGWLLVGCVQLVVMLAVIAPLQHWRPVEALVDKAAVRVDVLYTLIHRLGAFRVALFFTLDPVFDELFSQLRVAGVPTFHLDALWLGVSDIPWVSFVLYLVVLDLLNYAIHRGQHAFEWWWRLHSLHHAQRQMTMWTDNRNHLLDDVLRDIIIAVVAQLIGIAPGQFVAVVALSQLCESFQHANVRIWFGTVGERLLVSPRFHRLHHSIGIGHETIKKQALSAAGAHEVTNVGVTVLGGHNFGVLLPWWDVLFGTANFELKFDPTGVRDQVEQGVDYGRGFWAQQINGFKRLVSKY